MGTALTKDPFDFELAAPTLTSDILGQLFIMVWSKENGSGRLPDKSRLNEVFLKHFGGAPKTVQDVLHVDYRLGEPEISEITDFLVAGQRVGLVERPNPSHVPCISRLTSYWADSFLEDYESLFQAELTWLGSVVQNIKEPQARLAD